MVDIPKMPSPRERTEEAPRTDRAEQREESLNLLSLSEERQAPERTMTPNQALNGLNEAARAGDIDAMHKVFSGYQGTPDEMNDLTNRFGQELRKYGMTAEYQYGNNRMLISSVNENGTTRQVFVAGRPDEPPHGRTVYDDDGDSSRASEQFGKGSDGHISPAAFGEMLSQRIQIADRLNSTETAVDAAPLDANQRQKLESIRGALISGNYDDLAENVRAAADDSQVMQALDRQFERLGIQFEMQQARPQFPDRGDAMRITFRDRPDGRESVRAHLDIPMDKYETPREASMVNVIGGHADVSTAMQSTELFMRMIKKQLERRA